jgi:hypothetical protein
MERALYIFIFLVQLTFAGIAQEQEPYRFYGRVMKKDAFTPVKFAYVVNITRGKALLADSLGYFEMDVMAKDTLYISALSFADRQYCVPSKMPHEYSEWIYLSGRSYELKEATIHYLGTYQEFKEKVKRVKLPEKERLSSEALKIFPKLLKEPDPYAGPGITSPVSLIYMALSGEMKKLKKARGVHQKMETMDQYRHKFNTEIVSQATGLKGGELDRFMHFCSFSESFLLTSEQYEILEAVKQKYSSYVERKENGTLPSLENLGEKEEGSDTTETKF